MSERWMWDLLAVAGCVALLLLLELRHRLLRRQGGK